MISAQYAINSFMTAPAGSVILIIIGWSRQTATGQMYTLMCSILWLFYLHQRHYFISLSLCYLHLLLYCEAFTSPFWFKGYKLNQFIFDFWWWSLQYNCRWQPIIEVLLIATEEWTRTAAQGLLNLNTAICETIPTYMFPTGSYWWTNILTPGWGQLLNRFRNPVCAFLQLTLDRYRKLLIVLSVPESPFFSLAYLKALKHLQLETTLLPFGSLNSVAALPLFVSLSSVYHPFPLIAFLLTAHVKSLLGGDRFPPSSAVDTWSMAGKGEEVTLLMIEEMVSHLIFSLCLAHLGPCDNTAIDSNKPGANSLPAKTQLQSKAITFTCLFKCSCTRLVLKYLKVNDWSEHFP